MNPWLEGHWGDIHTRLSMYACDAIERALPPGLQARVEEYLAVESPFDEELQSHRFAPDISLYETTPTAQTGSPSGRQADASNIAPLDEEPVLVKRIVEPITLRYIEIADIRGKKRVITAIEFLSPANKTEAGAEQYRSKQKHLARGNVNLVEIDLLRKGRWVINADQNFYPRSLAQPYRICVTRSTQPDQSEVYRATYGKALPSIRIPLRPTDADIRLPLQAILNQAYLNGRYGDTLDYSLPPVIAMSLEGQAEVDQIIAQVD
jgi:hypothetical protein